MRQGCLIQVPYFQGHGAYTCLYFLSFLAVRGLRCCAGLSLLVESGSYPLVAVHRLLILVASLLADHGL